MEQSAALTLNFFLEKLKEPGKYGLVNQQMVTKATISLSASTSGEEIEKANIVLQTGHRITVRDDHPFFIDAQYIKPGDKLTFLYDDSYTYKPEDGDREYKYLTGFNEVMFEAGHWSDKPDARLEGRSRNKVVRKDAKDYSSPPPENRRGSTGPTGSEPSNIQEEGAI